MNAVKDATHDSLEPIPCSAEVSLDQCADGVDNALDDLERGFRRPLEVVHDNLHGLLHGFPCPSHDVAESLGLLVESNQADGEPGHGNHDRSDDQGNRVSGEDHHGHVEPDDAGGDNANGCGDGEEHVGVLLRPLRKPLQHRQDLFDRRQERSSHALLGFVQGNPQTLEAPGSGVCRGSCIALEGLAQYGNGFLSRRAVLDELLHARIKSVQALEVSRIRFAQSL